MARKVYHWRDPGPIARLTLWAVAASVAVNVSYPALDLYYRPDLAAEAGQPVDRLYEALTDVLSLLWLVFLAPGAVWLYRVAANAHSWKPAMRHSPASAWVWFAVPLAQLFMPYRVLAEVYRVTGAGSRRVLVLFWIVNVVSVLGTYGYIALSLRDQDSIVGPMWANLTATALNLAVHPMFAWLVIDLTKVQQDSTRIAEAFGESVQPA